MNRCHKGKAPSFSKIFNSIEGLVMSCLPIRLFYFLSKRLRYLTFLQLLRQHRGRKCNSQYQGEGSNPATGRQREERVKKYFDFGMLVLCDEQHGTVTVFHTLICTVTAKYTSIENSISHQQKYTWEIVHSISSFSKFIDGPKKIECYIRLG